VFADRVAIAHPTITKLADTIRREQFDFEVKIAQIRPGHEPKPKRAPFRKIDERFKRLVDDYANVDLGEHLKGIASNITLSKKSFSLCTCFFCEVSSFSQ